MKNNTILQNYINDGYVISKNLLEDNEILSLRKEFDEEFVDQNENEGVSRLLDDFKNPELAKKIIKIFSSNHLKKIKVKLEELSKSRVSLLPPFEVHKNYHVNLREFHGWHRDCGGEMRYDYCKNILSKKNYLFSKVGIYLQNNGDYGGSIDVIKTSHRNFSKFKVLIRKIKNIPLKTIFFLHKFFKKLYLLIPESFFMFMLKGKKLFPQKGSAVFFDSRIIHRGSPISKKNLNDVKFISGKYKAFLPKIFDKYSIYCHFGSTEAVDSYMFDRLKRAGNSDELKRWIKQIKFISEYDMSLADEINLIIDPIKKKYSKYL